MALLKSIAALFQKLLPTVKAVISSPYFMIIAIILVLALIVLLVYKIRKRKKAATQDQEPEEQEQEPPMAPKALVSVWKTYIKKIPLEFRRAILLYHPFVVLGASGSGKSGVVDAYSDWKNQSDQFYPSFTENPDLQVYQGSKVIIQELSAAVLENTTNEARIALVKLWKAFFRREEITAVVTVRVQDLLNDNKDSLISQAQILRGKLNILSQIMKRPVPVHLAVTFMDTVTGYDAFLNFNDKKGLTTHIEFTKETDLAARASNLFEENLTHALVSESSSNYLDLLAYLNQQPELSEGIEQFINILVKPDPLATAPRLDRIFFTSAKANTDTLSNPFKRQEKPKPFWHRHPYFKHQVAALLLLVLGSFYLGFSHSYKEQFVRDLNQEVADLEQEIVITPENNRDLEKLADKANAISNHSLLPFLVDFHPDAERQLRADVLNFMRTRVLTHELDKLRKGGGTYEDVRIMLALIYASNSNRLGDLILDNPGLWNEETGLSKKFITSYITLADSSWDTAVSMTDLTYEKPPVREESRQLKLFVNAIKDIEANGFIAKDRFAALRQEAKILFQGVSATPKSGLQDVLFSLLNEETVLNLRIYGKTQNQDNQDIRLADFLYNFEQLTYDYPAPGDLSMTKFFDNIEAMLDFKEMSYKKFPVDIDGKSIWLDLRQIHHTLKLSCIITFIREYITDNAYPGGYSFFSPDRKYQDLNAALSTENKFFFTAKKVIDGRYTQKAYDEDVKPPLERVPALMDKLPLSDDEKQRLSSFIYREAELYAQRYAQEYTKYYNKFSIRADSLGELRFIINQILLPMSQFQEFMLTLKTNLDLEYGKNDYFNPIMMNLSSLGFMKIIMQNEKDFFPELEKYKSILRMLLADLETDGATIPPEPGSQTADLNRILSPAARITLSIFRNDTGSYMNLIKKWSTSVGVPERMGYPFLEPVYQVYSLGLNELNTQVADIWTRLKLQYLGKDLESFPFNTSAAKDADPQNILKLMKKDGQFWTQFNMFIAPLCQKVNGKWQKRDFEMGSISLPDRLLDNVNRLTHLSTLLVNDKNEPQPLLVDIKADILPKIENRIQYVILTYLQSDTSAVYGFNQRPAWETFKINWWKESQSSIGVEFSEGEDNEFKVYRNDTIPKSYWSFYRLLQKAKLDPVKNAWTWHVDSPENLNWKRAVTFYIKEDPFLVFKENRIDQ